MNMPLVKKRPPTRPMGASGATAQQQEVLITPLNGWIAVVLYLILAFSLGAFILGQLKGEFSFLSILLSVTLGIALLVIMSGFFIQQPNMGRTFTFFGSYVGSFKEEGFWFTNPFFNSTTVSLKTNNHASEVIKVNDSRGSPVEIVAVISYRVANTRLAVFGVEDPEHYLATQCEAALRQIASQHPYESDKDGELSLRSDLDDVADLLRDSVQQHCQIAGLNILDARISHLSYAPEVAQLMLRKQQAQAIVSARQTLVDGAVGMIEGALVQLEQKKIANLNDTQRAQLVINMMTVLLSESGAQPVVSLDSKS